MALRSLERGKGARADADAAFAGWAYGVDFLGRSELETRFSWDFITLALIFALLFGPFAQNTDKSKIM